MIRVYILTEVSKERSKTIADALFSDGRFEVVIPNFDYIPDTTVGAETKKILNILINSKKQAPEKPVLIVKDSSTTNLTGSQLAKMTVQAVDQQTFDLFYLCRWMDDCDSNKKIGTFDTNKLVSMMSSTKAQGIQAIMFSRDGRDKVIDILKLDDTTDLSKILYDKLSKKHLTAIVSNPNMIEYDLALSGKSMAYKTTTCKIADVPVDDSHEKTICTGEHETWWTIPEMDNTWAIAIGIILLIMLVMIFRR